MVANKNPFTQATRSIFMSNDLFLDFSRWLLKRDPSVSNQKATLVYQQYSDKNTFIPKKVYCNQSCYRCHHNWHCDRSDLHAAQFSSVRLWCWGTYMKETHTPSSYKWASCQGFILKQNGNTKTNPGQYPKRHALLILNSTKKPKEW